jgi:hypothetical protein
MRPRLSMKTAWRSICDEAKVKCRAHATPKVERQSSAKVAAPAVAQ